MKILWFTNTPSKYDQGSIAYHGGGWIESLEELVTNQENIELAVSFFHKKGFEKEKRGSTTYYPILRKSQKKSPFTSVINGLVGRIESEPKIIPNLLKIVEDFKPDIVHVFGTEEVFATIQKYTNIPVVIHLQGLITPCLNAYFPPNTSSLDFILSRRYFFKNLTGRGVFALFLRFQNQAKREKLHLVNSKFLMGRTNWDFSISSIYAPNSHYFHINEVLRPVFYDIVKKEYNLKNSITIISTLSEAIYKGIDVVLKCANVLKQDTNIKFKWQIIGLDESSDLLNYFISSLKIYPSEVNVEFVGKKNSNELIALLKDADLFVHPSYIDNSPNSVCEAQIIGLPVIACNVGGVSTIVEHEKTGILVPANGVFEIVSTIINYVKEPDKYFVIGRKGREFALYRHNTENIVNNLLDAYLKIIKCK